MKIRLFSFVCWTPVAASGFAQPALSCTSNIHAGYSERDQFPAAIAESRRPRAAVRNNCLAIIWESLNSPATFSRVVAARLFNITTQPNICSIVDNGATVFNL